jgi:hypothetical protein
MSEERRADGGIDPYKFTITFNTLLPDGYSSKINSETNYVELYYKKDILAMLEYEKLATCDPKTEVVASAVFGMKAMALFIEELRSRIKGLQGEKESNKEIKET